MVRRIKFFCIFIFLTVVLFGVSSVKAASGITVSPALINTSIEKNQIEVKERILIKNNENYPVVIKTEIGPVDLSDGSIKYLNSVDDVLNQAIYFEQSVIEVMAGESSYVDIIIKPGLLNPGGNYAVAYLQQTASQSNLGLSTKVAVNLFITREDGAERQLTVESIGFDRFLFDQPKSATINFKNEGNVAIIPRGVLTISDADLKNIAAKAVINQESLTMYPNRGLSLETIFKVKNSWLPKRQYLTAQYRYDGSHEIKSETISYWFMPIKTFVLSALILLVLTGVIFKIKKPKKTTTKTAKVKTQPQLIEDVKSRKI